MHYLRTWSTKLWVALVVLVAGYGVYRQPISFDEIANRFTLWSVVAALALIVLGKLLTIALVSVALRAAGEDRGWRFAWRVYSIADISKYLPGGIWGIAGRLALYRQAGIDLAKGLRILLVETAILVAFSLAVGLGLLLHARPLAGTASQWLALASIAASLVALTWILLQQLAPALVFATSIFTMLAWLAFGASFALVAAESPAAFAELAGLFDIGFAAGQLAIFAPSGIGVRELAVAALSNPATSPPARLLIEVVAAHRLIWIAADFLVLVPALAFPPVSPRDPGETGQVQA